MGNNEDELAGAKSRAVATAVSSVLSSHRSAVPKTTSTTSVEDADQVSNEYNCKTCDELTKLDVLLPQTCISVCVSYLNIACVCFLTR